MKLKLIRRIQT